MGQPVVHFEIGCRDSAKLRGFYERLFGWTTTPAGPAQMVDTKAGSGINGHFNSLGHEPHNYVLFYVQVDDLAASLKKAQELGGSTLLPPTEVPNMGHFAWFRDPEGTVVGLWKPVQR
jgi:predicted enzyme related to lactoylglutathione lyase